MKPTTSIALRLANNFLDSWLQYRWRNSNYVGLSVAVSLENKITYSKAFGTAAIDRDINLTTDHIFSMASQTKVVTAVIILRLAEQHQLQLDDKVHRYLPWVKNHKDPRMRKVTIRHLLAHSSGLLRDGTSADYWLLHKPMPTSRTLQHMILANDLIFTPGKGVKYSNLGYGLLGQIIQAVTNAPFALAAKKLFHDLNLALYADYSKTIEPNIPVGYGQPLEHIRQPFLKRKKVRSLNAAVGIYATPANMCALFYEIFNNNSRLLSRQSQQEMKMIQSQLKHGLDAGSEFGLGVEYQHVNDRRMFGHSGHLAGHVSATFIDPQTELAVSVATNAKDTPAVAIARGILGTISYFMNNVTIQDREGEGRFSVRLMNSTSSLQVIDLRTAIIAIDPDDWEPFAWDESLATIDDNTLQFATKGSVFNEGETLAYHFSKEKIKYVKLAGVTLHPQ
jgi:D-alanyl-D-alanine carboxypeptidase